jgi:hypothetical protein
MQTNVDVEERREDGQDDVSEGEGRAWSRELR